MTSSSRQTELSDAAERRRAIETFDRNLIVTAGAGTGKTTLLVDRLVHLLVRNPDPLRITEIVALTFTNKAANELKLRLRERLHAYLVESDHERARDPAQQAETEAESLTAHYQLSKDELHRRIHEALRNIERSDIGTIHSFASMLLRLYPLEAGVDPQFHEDDGREFDRRFDEQWDVWLDQELSLRSSHADEWRKIFAKVTLDQIKALAKSLSSEAIELRRDSTCLTAIPQPMRSWLADLECKTTALIERHPEDRTNGKLLRAALRAIHGYRRGAAGLKGGHDVETKTLHELKSINPNLKGWLDDDIAKAQEVVRAAKGLLQVDPELCGLLWALLVPFAERFRAYFVSEGFISFDGLLIRARNLVRDNVEVRAELKRQYRAILIDEFQDTDPIQYEILLYLAEEFGDAAKDWRRIRLKPGKVFVVGDPKQSIYAFRRADIEAYLEVVERIIQAQDGIECRLTTNFRSNAAILDVVNGIFTSLIQARDGIQPSYIAIHPAPNRSAPADSRLPKVLVRKIIPEGSGVNADKARRLEGESLARWLKEEVLHRTVIRDARGEEVYVQPRDVAILFRKLTDIHEYLEPLRRQEIRYVVEGERHFYAAKEIIDAVNLFRAIDNPHDRLALVGVLRSPLGGLTDREIYDLHCEDLLDYRNTNHMRGALPATVSELYQILLRLHEQTRLLPIGEAVSHIFATLPVKLLAACAFDGEQAVANLEKLREQAERLGREGLTTLKEAIRLLQERVLEVKEEGESVLAEESLDAVRIMSIHKAKGLEFPLVVLAGCQSGTDGRLTTDAESLSDWSSGLTGVRIGPISDLAGLYIAEKNRTRADEEQKRVLYVAMTRAREHLIVSCAPPDRSSNGSFLSMLEETLSEEINSVDLSKTLRVGNGSIEIQAVSRSLAAPRRPGGKTASGKTESDWRPFIDTWRERRQRFDAILQTPLFLTPTFAKRQEEQSAEAFERTTRGTLSRTEALFMGDVAHRFLQQWNFAGETSNYRSDLVDLIDDLLPRELRDNRASIITDLEEIFAAFFRSKAYGEIAGSRILGREVPFLVPWNSQIMEGVIDILYECKSFLYLADFKTDMIDRGELSEKAARHRQQAQIYCHAARQSLGREVAMFKLIFLRVGEAVEIVPEMNNGLTLF